LGEKGEAVMTNGSSQLALIGFCVRLGGDRLSWTVEHLSSDETHDSEPLDYAATAEGTEEMLDYLRQLTASRVTRRQFFLHSMHSPH
jgi:hypothetical protein